MGDEFIKLPSGKILNISCIESLETITKIEIDDYCDEVIEKYLAIKTKTKQIYYEDVNFVDEIRKYIYVVNLESEHQ